MTDQTPSLGAAEPAAAPPSDPRKQAIDALMRLAAGRAWHDIELTDIARDFPPVFARFHADAALRTCARCGHVHPVPPPRAD